MGPRRLEIPVSHGHLEALLDETPSAVAAAVFCHPHPLYGGTMRSNVVHRVAAAMRAAGAAVLRFNFRGVGRSTGVHGHGEAEEEDVRAALSLLSEVVPGTPLWLGGFSFGARVAFRVGATEGSVAGMLGVGLATRLFDFSFLSGNGKPKAVIHAELDEYGPADAVRALVATWPEPRFLELIPDAGHLFGGKLDELEAAAGRAAGFLLRNTPR